MKGKTSNIFMFIILGLLILGLAGFGIGNFGGSVSSVARVGDQDITVDDYARALQSELRAASAQTGQTVTLAQARAMGLDRVVLSRLVATAALDNETARMGVSVGDEQVFEQITQIPNFQGIDGSFDREAYEFALEQTGLNAREFEDNIRRESARTLLQGAVLGGGDVPATYADTLFDFISERRSFAWAAISPQTFEVEVPEPTEADLTAYYEENPGAFTLPERKAVTYVLLTPDMMMAQMDVPEAELREAYDARLAEFMVPERRLVDRIVFDTLASAEAARAAIDAGETDFDALATDRDLTADDIDLGPVSRDQLADESAEAVFALEDTGVVGPVGSGLGPALFRVNAILVAQETTFDEARDQLVADLTGDAARRAVAGEIEALDDLLAGGATLEDLAAESAMELGQITVEPGDEAGVAAYPEIRSAIAAVMEGDFPELATLEDGGIFALRLDELLAPELQPLAAVRADVVSGWRGTQVRAALQAEADRVAEDLKGGTSFEDQDLIAFEEAGVSRDAFIESLPPSMVTEVFGLAEVGDVTTVAGADTVYVAQLEAILPPDPANPEAASIRGTLQQNLAQGIAQDIFAAYAGALQAEAGLSIDQTAINAVQAQFP